VTGATGYLGRRVVAQAATRADVIGLVHRSEPPPAPAGVRYRQLDLTRPAEVQVALATLQPDAVIHTAAANPGSDAAGFTAVNVGGSAAVANAVAARRAGCRLVHVSTDLVHDGLHAPYTDDANPNPLNDYGRSKAEAEVIVLSMVPDAVAVRTSLIYGLDEPDRSTAGFIARLRRGERLELFVDVVRQPVWVEALAACLIRLALDDRSTSGLLNVAGSEAVTRAAFGRALLDVWKVRAPRDQVVDVEAAGRNDVPLDLRLRLDRARALDLETPGVSTVLAGAFRTR
jgi:dTDP-4-dehydrorhamnose reductase